MHLQNTFNIGVMVKQNVVQCPLHHVTYAPTEFEVTASKDLGDAFTRKFIIRPLTLGSNPKVTQNVAQYPLHHVTYSAKKLLRLTV